MVQNSVTVKNSSFSSSLGERVKCRTAAKAAKALEPPPKPEEEVPQMAPQMARRSGELHEVEKIRNVWVTQNGLIVHVVWKSQQGVEVYADNFVRYEDFEHKTIVNKYIKEFDCASYEEETGGVIFNVRRGNHDGSLWCLKNTEETIAVASEVEGLNPTHRRENVLKYYKKDLAADLQKYLMKRISVYLAEPIKEL